MILDSLIQRWCVGAYAPDERTRFNQYAEYVAFEPWIKGIKRHRPLLWLLLIGFAVLFIEEEYIVNWDTFVEAANVVLLFLGAMTLTFLLYGLKRYNRQDGTTFLFYIMMLVVLVNTCMSLPLVLQKIFGIVMLPVSFVVHHWIPMRHRDFRKKMKRFHAQQMQEAERMYKQSQKDEFDRWNHQRSTVVNHPMAGMEQANKYMLSVNDEQGEEKAYLSAYSESYADEDDDFEDNYDDDFEDDYDDDFEDDYDESEEAFDEEYDYDDDAPEDVTDTSIFDAFDAPAGDAQQKTDDHSAVFDAFASDDRPEQFAGFDPMEAFEEAAAAPMQTETAVDYEEDPYSDPEYAMEVARYLLESHATDPNQLKQRYRDVVRQHHPDNGGSNYLMQAINAVYDELSAQLK
jgi:hypothetical protein